MWIIGVQTLNDSRGRLEEFKMAEKTERVMKVTAQEMADAKIPLNGRDYCAHLLIPLLKCRKETYYFPWKCQHEKHAWDKCQYDDLMYRIREKERRKLQEKGHL